MEVTDSSELSGYMMSHPRTADFRVTPLVILLKELNSWNAKQIEPRESNHIKQNKFNNVRKDKIMSCKIIP
jgi:hypothetical protein